MPRTTQRIKENEQRNRFQMEKSKRKTLVKVLNKMEVSYFPDKEFNIIIIQMLIDLRRRLIE